MKITEFKRWFQGMIAGLPAGQGLSAGQVRALKEEIEALESDHMIPTKDREPSDPLRSEIDVPNAEPNEEEKALRGLEDLIRQIEKERRTNPSYPGLPDPLDRRYYDDHYWTRGFSGTKILMNH